MAKVILESWREGLEKISLTKLQVEMLGKSLKESKTNVDNLLENIAVFLIIDDEDLAKKFYEEATKIGVNCKITLS